MINGNTVTRVDALVHRFLPSEFGFTRGFRGPLRSTGWLILQGEGLCYDASAKKLVERDVKWKDCSLLWKEVLLRKNPIFRGTRCMENSHSAKR